MSRLLLVVLGAAFVTLAAVPTADAVCLGTAPDGMVGPAEECDDNNVVNGDGCSATCTIDNEFSCARAVSFANLDVENFAGSTANWTTSMDNTNGLQTVNTPTPSVALFGENAMLGTYAVRMRVETTDDDDFIGFVLGFNANDQTNAAASYLVFDWKQLLQDNVGPGFRLAHVKGVPTGAGQHASYAIPQRECPNPATSCTTQLANGRRFGTVGWADNTSYTVYITYRADRLEIRVDNQLEFIFTPADFAPGEFAGNVFPAGQIGFYTLSQLSVRYTNLAPFGPSACNVTQLAPLSLDRVTGTANVTINTAAQLTDTGDALQGNSVVVRSITAVGTASPGGTATVAANGTITFTPTNPALPAVYRLTVFACDNDATIPDCDEAVFTVVYSPDLDGDGAPNHADLDDDDDGIPDTLEGSGIAPDGDADNDGIFNYLDKTDRGNGTASSCVDTTPANGICDAPGIEFDRDRDGVPNHLDLDSDNDGLLDVIEARAALSDVGRNGRLDCTAYGTNGLCNSVETVADSGIVDYTGDGVGPDAALDTDADGLSDFLDVDSDGDGVLDLAEANIVCVDATNNGTCDGGDTDGDGVVNARDTVAGLGVATYADRPDTDADGTPDFRDLDADGDTLADLIEANSACTDTAAPLGVCDGPDANGDGVADNATATRPDTDADGRPDYRDVDADGDGVRDNVETTRDTDGDGFADFRDLDSDNDGIADVTEANPGCADTTPRNGKCDGADANNDGIADAATNQTPPDTDGDGAVDFRDLDADNDGLADVTEGGSGCADTTPADAVCDGPDSNGDGIVSSVVLATAPNSDADSTPDYRDLDSDNDGLVDLEEGNSGCLDANGNAVCDGPDTDGDGISNSIDGSPAFGDTTPTVPRNTDSTDTADYRDPDSDNDGTNDVAVSGCANTTPADAFCDGADTDADGVVDNKDGFDGFGILQDTDNDGASDVADLDDDNDGIADLDEPGDSDGDGIADSVDLDSDNDGLPDVAEAGHDGVDANRDGQVDCAGGFGANGFCDALETQADSGLARTPTVDTDGDGVRDFRDLDSDDDGIDDVVENGSSCADDPRDGTCDGGDADRDGVRDTADGTAGFGVGMDGYAVPPDTDSDGKPDYRDLDSDADGIFDNDEAHHGPDANNDGKIDGDDTDGDGIKDPVDGSFDFGGGGGDIDTDGDGMPDQRDVDSDNDGITDGDEAGNDPTDPDDTDGDGTPDFQDIDSDADAVGDETDNCRLVDNEDQADADDDGIGDACDDDDNNDGIGDGIGVKGGGCATTNGTSGGLIALALFGIVALRRRRTIDLRTAAAAIASVGALAAVEQDAHAQAAISSQYGAERFQLTGHRDGILAVEWADVEGHLALDVGLWFGYANDPVNLYQMSNGDRVGSLVANRYGGDLVAAIQLWDRLELGVGAPIIVSQSDELGAVMPTATDLSGAGLGDLRLSPKLTLLKQGRVPFAVAVMATITLPTSTSDDYGGDDGATVSPSLIVSHGHRYGARFSLHGGYRTRPEATSIDLVVDDEVFAAAGLGYRFASSLEVDASFDMATAADDVFGAFNRNAAEVRAGLGFDLARAVRLFAAGGVGVAEGFGTPDWRALVGLRLHTPDDPPQRKYIAVVEPLPTPVPEPLPEPEPEMLPPPPEPDLDKDTVVDRLDLCPEVAGEPANQGCPPDRDKDTVADAVDNCPDEPGPVENQGCKKQQLVKITAGKLEILDIVYFALNKAAIQKRSNRLLDDVAAVLVAHPEITKITVEGHTDSQGNDAYNKKLSQNRANAVLAYLVKQGVARDRLEAIGYGEERPKDTNDTKEGRAVNRRVEFTITGGAGVETKPTGPDGETLEK